MWVDPTITVHNTKKKQLRKQIKTKISNIFLTLYVITNYNITNNDFEIHSQHCILLYTYHASIKKIKNELLPLLRSSTNNQCYDQSNKQTHS